MVFNAFQQTSNNFLAYGRYNHYDILCFLAATVKKILQNNLPIDILTKYCDNNHNHFQLSCIDPIYPTIKPVL